MSLTNLFFLPFVAAVVILYYTLFRKIQWVWLLITSVAFYLLGGPQYIVFILVSSVTAYLTARKMTAIHSDEDAVLAAGEFDKEGKKAVRKSYTGKRRKWLLLALFVNIGILGVIKYTDFFLRGVSKILSMGGVQWLKQFHFVLPLGISFYTFMIIGYVLDVYWKRYPAEKNYFKVLLFASYFPHITQGPIGRYDRLSPQFEERHRFDYDNVTKGIQLMLWGFFEKMVIADRLAVFYKGVFSEWQLLTGLPLIIALIFLSMQLYLDFRGCMDICRGVSQMLGIELEENFKRPYFSKTMPEFWRRWHITLGAWFKDYLLYPVSTSKLCKKINKATRNKWGSAASRAFSTVIPAACVWLITGLWHGAAVCFLLWGIYHGILIIGGSLFGGLFEKAGRALHINMECWSFNLFRMIRTFFLSAVGRVFFVSAGFSQAVQIIGRTFDLRHHALYKLWDGSLYTYGLDRPNFVLAILLIALIWAVGMAQERGIGIRDWIAKQNLVFRWALYLGIIAAIFIFGMYGEGYDAAGFVYQQF